MGEDRSRVALGMNERVPVGALARPIEAPLTRSIVNPPRMGGYFELGVGVRPFIPVGDDIGLGLLGDIALTYHGERAWFLSTSLTPFGFSLTRGQDAGIVGWNVVGGFDHRLVELGVGVGLMLYTEERYTGSGYTGERTLSLSLSQTARFGALDGLHFWFANQLLLLDADMYDDRRFDWSGMSARFQIPVHAYTWLVLEGGGSYAGEAWGEIGLKLTIRGDGGPGTVFVTPSIGGAALRQAVSRVAGPMVGISVDWRL